jgi:hypothetical protein
MSVSRENDVGRLSKCMASTSVVAGEELVEVMKILVFRVGTPIGLSFSNVGSSCQLFFIG